MRKNYITNKQTTLGPKLSKFMNIFISQIESQGHWQLDDVTGQIPGGSTSEINLTV